MTDDGDLTDLMERWHRLLSGAGVKDDDVHLYMDWITDLIRAERQRATEQRAKDRRLWSFIAVILFILGGAFYASACYLSRLIEGEFAMADPQPVTTMDRLWSVEVGIAEARDAVASEVNPRFKRPIAYEFSNGKKFEDGDGPYANPAP